MFFLVRSGGIDKTMADALLDRTEADLAGPLALRGQPTSRRSPTCEFESRTRLFDLSVGVVEDLRREGGPLEAGPEDFCADFQVCLPYRGLFVWQVAGEDVVGDSNQIVFVRGGESYRMRGPRPDGYAELIITPDLDTLSEVAHVNGQCLADHPLFRRRTWRAQPHVQSCRTRFHHWASGGTGRDGLEADERLLALIRCALQQDGRQEMANGTRTARLIRRTKEFLEARLSSRILLTDIARAVGASPAYLTDLFTRVEGVSLHQYLTHLRLARALVELPHAEDLTALALDVGFSSHSHFTFAFRRTFGCTPSQFREGTRRATRPPVL
jgi:AraC-like DNA-binding protein